MDTAKTLELITGTSYSIIQDLIGMTERIELSGPTATLTNTEVEAICKRMMLEILDVYTTKMDKFLKAKQREFAGEKKPTSPMLDNLLLFKPKSTEVN